MANTLIAAINNKKIEIDACFDEVIAKGVTEVTPKNLAHLKECISQIDTSGEEPIVVYPEDYTEGMTSLRSALLEKLVDVDINDDLRTMSSLVRENLVHFTDCSGNNEVTSLSEYLTSLTAITLIQDTIDQAYILASYPELKILYLPNLTYWKNDYTGSTRLLEYLYMPNHVSEFPGDNKSPASQNLRRLHVYPDDIKESTLCQYEDFKNLYFLTFSAEVNSDISVKGWTPEHAMDASRTTLINTASYDDHGEEVFNNNQEKFIWYFINKFVPCFADMTGQSSPTLSLQWRLYNFIVYDNPQIGALLTNKNWTLASV